MSHRRFAEINSDNLVVRVIVAESAEWCKETLGGTWLETFKDRSERFNYAGVGFTYDADRDAFIPPKPFDSWVLDESTCLWQAPIPYPADGGDYTWDEETGDWLEVVDEAV